LNIVVVGAGTVGYSLAEHLSRRGIQISVVDNAPDLCEQISAKLDVFSVCGQGSSPGVLQEAGIEKSEMMIAVTPSDETNLLACYFAKNFGVKERIARVKSGEYLGEGPGFGLGALGVTRVIEPEKEVVRKILQYIQLPGLTESANFQSDTVYLRGYRVDESMPIAGKRLSEIDNLTENARILIVLIIRENKSILPRGDEQVLPSDQIVAIMPGESLPAFRRWVNQPQGAHKKLIVWGNSLTAFYLARELTPFADRVILVDPDKAHGEWAASQLNDIEVLHGDCTDVDMLHEINVRDVPFFIAADEDSEDNVMACLLAKAEGAKEVIAISNSIRHSTLFLSLGIDHIIAPYQVTSQSIISDILRVPLGSLATLKNVDVVVNRYVVQEGSRVVGKPLHVLSDLWKKSIIIGSIFRGGEVIIPSGNTEIEANDEILILSQPENASVAKKLFSSKGRLL